jgi:hypothetical protein
LADGESAEDVIVGCALLASRRAALAGRAPSGRDVAAALGLFGFLQDAPADLVADRRARFRSVAREYDAQRQLVDSVPEATLLLPPDQAGAPDRRSDLLGAPGEPSQ